MHVRHTGLPGVLLLEPVVHRDVRGWFSRTFDSATALANGIDPDAFYQDSQSHSVRGVIRGLHGRVGTGEAKLVRCARGALHDVVVDARLESPTFGRWRAFRLDDKNMLSIYVPRGFLHGFQALTEAADTCYRIDAEHNPTEDISVRWDDPSLGIDWPLAVTVMSDKDRTAGSWEDVKRILRRPAKSPSMAAGLR